jgi:glycosyltransferase involved in cell wall biosynthesis
MKKLLFITHRSSMGGPSQSLYLNILELRDKYQVKVIIPENGPLYNVLKDLRVEVEIFNARWRYIPIMFLKIINEKIDVVYGNNFSNDSFLFLVASKLARVPFIWHIREMLSNSKRARNRLMLATKIITVSKSCKNAITKFLPRKDIEVVYNGVDIKDFDIDSEKGIFFLEREYGIPANSINIVTVGSIDKRKNQLEIIECISKLEIDINYNLIIVGKVADVDYKEQIDSAIKSNNLKDRVFFTGVSNNVKKILSGSDIFLFLSISDPHPRAVLEAMASGLPVVAYDIDGVGESIINGTNGFLAAIGDKHTITQSLSKLIEDNKLRESFWARNKEHLKNNFNYKQTAKKIEKIIMNV